MDGWMDGWMDREREKGETETGARELPRARCFCWELPCPLIGTGLMGTWLNGYLVLEGNIPLRTPHLKHIVKLWAKYPFSRCRTYMSQLLFAAGTWEGPACGQS